MLVVCFEIDGRQTSLARYTWNLSPLSILTSSQIKRCQFKQEIINISSIANYWSYHGYGLWYCQLNYGEINRRAYEGITFLTLAIAVAIPHRFAWNASLWCRFRPTSSTLMNSCWHCDEGCLSDGYWMLDNATALWCLWDAGEKKRVECRSDHRDRERGGERVSLRRGLALIFSRGLLMLGIIEQQHKFSLLSSPNPNLFMHTYLPTLPSCQGRSWPSSTVRYTPIVPSWFLTTANVADTLGICIET